MSKDTCLSDKYCEGWCKDDGGKGKFNDCTGCEIAELEADRDAAFNGGMERAAEIVRAERNDLASPSYNDALDVVGELIGQPVIPASVARAADVQHLQEETLRGLGIFLRGYGPEGSFGRGGVQYLNEDLQNRLMYAGFQAQELKAYILGKRAMTMRTLFRLAGAAHGTDRGGDRAVGITLVIEDIQRT